MQTEDLYKDMELGGILSDGAVSAYKHRLVARKQGQMLHAVLRRGDVVRGLGSHFSMGLDTC